MYVLLHECTLLVTGRAHKQEDLLNQVTISFFYILYSCTNSTGAAPTPTNTNNHTFISRQRPHVAH